MPTGVIVLLVVAILVYFGLLHRVLDRMRLDDRTALFVIFLMVLGSFFNLTILRRPLLTVNVGGAIIPIGIAVYLISTADTSREKIRGSLAAIVSGAAIYLSAKLLNPEEQTMVIDPSYFFALIAGVVGYLSGRSRRSAFVAGTMGVVLADVAHYVEISIRGIPGRTWIGGAGAFDAVVIAGVLAVGLAEVVGETREYLTRGPLKGGPGTRRGGDGRESENGEPGGDRAGDHDRGPGDRFVAAFGVGGGSERGGDSRDSHRAGRARRKQRGSRARPITTGGAGWEPPVVGDGGPTEPSAGLGPGTGIDLTGIADVNGGVSATKDVTRRYGSPRPGRAGRGKSGRGLRDNDRGGSGHGQKGGEVND